MSNPGIELRTLPANRVNPDGLGNQVRLVVLVRYELDQALYRDTTASMIP